MEKLRQELARRPESRNLDGESGHEASSPTDRPLARDAPGPKAAARDRAGQKPGLGALGVGHKGRADPRGNSHQGGWDPKSSGPSTAHGPVSSVSDGEDSPGPLGAEAAAGEAGGLLGARATRPGSPGSQGHPRHQPLLHTAAPGAPLRLCNGSPGSTEGKRDNLSSITAFKQSARLLV